MPPPELLPERLIAAFAGAVHSGAASPAVNCRLAGVEQGSGIALEVHFSGASAEAPLGILQDVRVFEQGREGARHWLLLAGSARHVVQARSAQVHRMPRAAFYAAVPPPSLTLVTRLGWVLLLNLLRIPGLARLVAWLRSP
jgi:hypothetical protein